MRDTDTLPSRSQLCSEHLNALFSSKTKSTCNLRHLKFLFPSHPTIFPACALLYVPIDHPLPTPRTPLLATLSIPLRYPPHSSLCPLPRPPIPSPLRFRAMSTYAPPPTLPILHPPTGPSSTPLSRPADALHRTHPQQCQQVPPPPSRMDPLDLLSRVALGQYPIPTEQEPQPRATSTPRPSHPYPLQPFNTTSASPSHSSAHHIQYQHCDYSKTTPSYSHTTISSPYPSQPISSHQRHVCVADLSPVSSEDGLPAVPHHPTTSRPIPDMPSRHSKVMRSATDADVHKPRSQPSRFCHICSRTSKKVGLVACGNFSSGSCRKVICQKCFTDHQWNWEEASNLGAKWLCTHCRRECPERAQCAIYKRTNDRRREQQQQQKSGKGGTRSAPKSNGGD